MINTYKRSFGTLALIIGLTSAIAFVGPVSAFADQTCTPSNQTVVSDETNTFTHGETSGQAALTYSGSSVWTSIPGANWIWESYLVQHPQVSETITINKSFDVEGTIATSTLSIAADDYFSVSVNGTSIATENGEGNFLAPKNYDVTSALIDGTNTISIDVTNAAPYSDAADATGYTNPGGVIYSLAIASNVCSTSTPASNTGTIVSGGGAGASSLGGYEAPTATTTSATTTTTGNTGTTGGHTTVVTTNSTGSALTGSNSGSVTSLSTATTTATSTASTTIDSGSTAVAAANSALSYNLFSKAGLEQLFLALIIILILYIIWLMTREKWDLVNSANRLTTRTVIFYVVTAAIASIILALVSLGASIVPLIVLTVITLIGIYLNIL